MTLPELFDLSLRGRASQAGLEWQDRSITFGEIDAGAWRLARELSARGLSPGDRLAVWLPNCPEYIELAIACARIGVILVPINVLYREREAGHILQDAAPHAVVVEEAPPGPSDVAAWALDDLIASAEGHSANPVPFRPEDDAPAALIYTSGTTGPAKGAIITHNNLVANAATLLMAWQITAADRLLLALPLFHVHGLANGVYGWLASGARMRLLPRFDHRTACAELLRFKPTLFFGVPTMYVRLLEIDARDARRIGRAARLFVSGSAPLPSSVYQAFQDRFGHAILERYGMTETLMTLSNPYVGERRAGTVGRPLPGVSIRIVGRDSTDVAEGDTGELWVRGPTVCAGYWNRGGAWASACSDGWFHTGDLAARSEDGYVTLHGRAHELIISGGFNIYPREIEEVLAGHDAVQEAAVVGVPDEVRGEVPVAFVVPRPGRSVEPAVLTQFCRARLASFKVPRAVLSEETLPRTALGKVQKAALLARWQQRGD